MTQGEQLAIYEKIEEVKDNLRDKIDEKFDDVREDISELKEYVHKNNNIKKLVEKHDESIDKCTSLLEAHLVVCTVRADDKKGRFSKRATSIALCLTFIGLVVSIAINVF